MFYTVAATPNATGLSKSTILGAIESRRITGTRVLPGVWEIQHSDLHRLYAAVGEPSIGINSAQQNAAPDAANFEAEIADHLSDAGDSLRQSLTASRTMGAVRRSPRNNLPVLRCTHHGQPRHR
jgi:hypothetical protein